MAPEAPARRVLSLCRLYAGMRAIGVTPQEALLQKMYCLCGSRLGPALNPIERVWRDLKDALAWLPFPDLEAPQVYVDVWQPYEASTLQTLTSDAYVVEAIHALVS